MTRGRDAAVTARQGSHGLPVATATSVAAPVEGAQLRSSSATWKASSSDWLAFSRGSQAVS